MNCVERGWLVSLWGGAGTLWWVGWWRWESEMTVLLELEPEVELEMVVVILFKLWELYWVDERLGWVLVLVGYFLKRRYSLSDENLVLTEEALEDWRVVCLENNEALSLPLLLAVLAVVVLVLVVLDELVTWVCKSLYLPLDSFFLFFLFLRSCSFSSLRRCLFSCCAFCCSFMSSM